MPPASNRSGKGVPNWAAKDLDAAKRGSRSRLFARSLCSLPPPTREGRAPTEFRRALPRFPVSTSFGSDPGRRTAIACARTHAPAPV